VKIDTGSSVLARAVGALVYVDVTVFPGVSGFTGAVITSTRIRTCCTIFTRVRNPTLINVHLATLKRFNTGQLITTSFVDASHIITALLALA